MIARRSFSSALVCVLLATLACKRESTSPTPGTTAPAAPHVHGEGTIEGTVNLTGTVPTLPPIPTSASVARDCGTQIPDPSLSVGPNGALADAVVFIDAPPTPSPARVLPSATLDQKRCAYTPTVLAATAGSPLRMLNSDPLVHSIHAREAGLPLFQFAMPLQGIPSTKPLARAGIVQLSCDLHPWMRAWARVFDHPYFAVTDAAGHFRIDGAPAGPHTLTVWQPRLGTTTQAIDVPAGGTAKVTVAWSASLQASER